MVRRPKLPVAAAAALCALAAAYPGTAAAAIAHRVGTAPRVPAGARALGSVSSTTPVAATVALTPSDPAGLAAYAHDVSVPGSPLYHQFLSVSQFAQRFGASAADVASVRSALASTGLSVGPVSSNRLSIAVSAPASTARAAFSTGLERYQLRDGTTGYANTSAPAVPSSVAGLVQGVVGLDTLAVSSPAGLSSPHVAGAHTAGTATPAATGAGPKACTTAQSQATRTGAYTAGQIASAYGLSQLYGQGDLGAGKTIALFELSSYSSSDIAQYQSCYGTSASVTNVTVGTGPGTSSGAEEDVLDIEDVIGLAPAASIRVYEGPNTSDGVLKTYQQIVTDNTAQVISTSWGECEADQGGSGDAASENTIFQEAAVQGQSVFAATGDNGADDCASHSAAAVDDPASQPYVTAVGGTSLSAATAGATETVWNDASGAGGGGVSTVWAQPSFQSGFALPQSATSCGGGGTTCRQVPDVSADADPNTGYLFYYSGGWQELGGTSAAAPTWAALTALADGLPACSALNGRIGLATTALYTAAGTGYASDFKDITSGGNGYGGVSGFAAGPGFDMASGLGAPIASSLAPALCGDLVRIAQPGAQTSPPGTAQTLQMSAVSSAGTAVNWQASGLPPGLTLDASTGQISGTALTGGVYTVSAVATDASGSAGDTTFTWTVAKPAVATSTTTTTTTTATTTTTTTTTTTPPAPTTTAPVTTPPVPVTPPTTTTTPPAAAPPLSAPPVATSPGPTPPVAFPVVTLRRPAPVTSDVGRPVQLQIVASDSAGLPLSYRASGLPRGVSLNPHTGLLSGAPKVRGRSIVTVSAVDSRGSSAVAVFTWTVRTPAASATRVTGSLRVTGRRAVMTASAGSASKHRPIRQIVVRLTGGAARFATRSALLARGISVRDQRGRAVTAQAVVRGDALTLTFTGGLPTAVTIRASSPAVTPAPLDAASMARRAPRALVRLTVVIA